MVRMTADDADEQRVIDDVEQFGWHVIGIEDDPEGPGFAYSVGMFHTLNHPEIILFGLKYAKSMTQIINAIGDEVRKGTRFQDWYESDQILDGYSCVFRSVPIEVYPEYLGYAMWYYRPESVPFLQCVWPDNRGRYPWHPDCPPEIRKRQPILNSTTDWPFNEGKNRVAFTTTKVLDGSRPILLVSHDAEGDWQFLCGTTNQTEDLRIVCLHSIIELDPSLAQVANLPQGWEAKRKKIGGPWRRSKCERVSDDL